MLKVMESVIIVMYDILKGFHDFFHECLLLMHFLRRLLLLHSVKQTPIYVLVSYDAEPAGHSQSLVQFETLLNNFR